MSITIEFLSHFPGCRKQYHVKTIERVVVRNNIEYYCSGRIYQAFCGGDCKVDTTYNPGLYKVTPVGVETVTPPSYSTTSGGRTYCQFMGAVSVA